MFKITFVKIKAIGDCFSDFHFYMKMNFSAKMKIKETIFNNLDLYKCYLGHDLEQHSRGFSH